MRSQVTKVSGSLVLQLPESYCEAAGLQDGSPVDLDITDDRLTIRPVQYGVRDLLARLRPQPLEPDVEKPAATGAK